jgi:hypothetical protein
MDAGTVGAKKPSDPPQPHSPAPWNGVPLCPKGRLWGEHSSAIGKGVFSFEIVGHFVRPIYALSFSSPVVSNQSPPSHAFCPDCPNPSLDLLAELAQAVAAI